MALKDIVKVAHYYDVKYGFNKEAQEASQEASQENWQLLTPEEKEELATLAKEKKQYNAWLSKEKQNRLKHLRYLEEQRYRDKAKEYQDKHPGLKNKKTHPNKGFGKTPHQVDPRSTEPYQNFEDYLYWKDYNKNLYNGTQAFKEGDTLYSNLQRRYMRFDGKDWQPAPTEITWDDDAESQTSEKLTSGIGKQLKQQVQKQQEQEKWDATPIEQKLEGIGVGGTPFYQVKPLNTQPKPAQQKPSSSMGQSALKPVTQQIGKELAKQVGTQAKKQIDSGKK